MCPGCNADLAEDVHFCPKCGVQVSTATSAPPPYPAYPPALLPVVPRVQKNLQTLGILWCVFGAYRVIAGLVGMIVLHAATLHSFGSYSWPFNGFNGPTAPGWMGVLMPVLAVYRVFVAALSLLVGFSLLTRRPWGRTLAIIVGILTLLKPLLGTALGIYTLWVLAPSASGEEYDSISTFS